MMDLTIITPSSVVGAIVASFFACILLIPSASHVTGLPRHGGDPGWLDLKSWLARISFLRKGSRLVYENYHRDKDANYVVRTLLGDQVVLGPKYLPELRMLAESSLSATAALVDSVLGNYSGVDILLKDHFGSDVCRAQLTKNMDRPTHIWNLDLANIVPQMDHELDLALSEVFQASQGGDAASYVAYKSIYTIISRISSRVFVGAPTCYETEWIEPVNAFPMDVEKTKFALLLFPSFIRPLITYFLPMKWRLIRNHRRVRDLLFPLSRIEKSKEEYTVLNFLLQASKDTDPESLTSRMILLTAAAFHNSSTAALQAVYNLCVMPESVEVLRVEIEQALRQSKGEWNLETLNSLNRLDSFLKESQRLNSLSFLGFNRKVMSEVKLSDGTSIPPGQNIKMPSGPMARDDANYADAKTFDGDRFLRKIVEGEKQHENEYAGIEPGNLTWGQGRFSCPGRWYASAMNKLLLAKLLFEYEFELTENKSVKPENMIIDVRVLPNMSKEILFRRKQQ